MPTNENSHILHIAFYPWFALGHLTSFLRLANKLAERGHKVSYFLPAKTQLKLASQNHHPDHLTFFPITVPPVDGLPPGAETTNDVSVSAAPLIMTAMDMTRDTLESHLTLLKPNFVLYDFAYWMPELARNHGFKAVHYITGNIARYAGFAAYLKNGPAPDMRGLPPGLTSPIFKHRTHEAKVLNAIAEKKFGATGKTLIEMFDISFKECDAIGVKTSKEMEEFYVEFVEKTLDKPVLLAGPVVPQPPSAKLDEYFDTWLKGFGDGSVIYCALGSECLLEVDQFQELALGLELTGRPFLAALKPPKGHTTVESALPVGLAERIKGKGMICGGWVQQQQILRHPSVGCFITHCGVGSLSEALVSTCQIVLMPQAVDQFVNARQMNLELKVGVEIEPREEDGFFTKKAIHSAISMVMDEGSEVGREVRENHAQLREIIMKDGLEDSYISSFIERLQQLLG